MGRGGHLKQVGRGGPADQRPKELREKTTYLPGRTFFQSEGNSTCECLEVGECQEKEACEVGWRKPGKSRWHGAVGSTLWRLLEDASFCSKVRLEVSEGF